MIPVACIPDRKYSTVTPDSPKLPEGWAIEGLWTGMNTGNPKYTEVTTDAVTNTQVENANRIVVSYTSPETGAKEYRTIHGADSVAQIGSLINYTTKRVSPVGRKST